MLMAFISQKLGDKKSGGEKLRPDQIWHPEDFLGFLPVFALPDYMKQSQQESLPQIEFDRSALEGIYADAVEGFIEGKLWEEIITIFNNIAQTLGKEAL